MKKYFLMPKVQMIFVLFLFFVITSSQLGLPNAQYLLITSVGFCVLFDVLFAFIRRRKVFTTPFAAIVTGLILALIIDPSALWYQILAVCAAAMAMKNFLRIKNRHVLNPAASGLLAGWAIFQLQPSWWAATLFKGENELWLNALLYVGLLGVAFVSCYKVGRYVSVFTYIALYSLLFAIMTATFTPSAFFKTFTSPGMLFYALVMLPEPMTSPVNKRRQALYGAIVAFFNAVFVYTSFAPGITNLPDSSILALLIGNILFFKFR